MEIRYFHKQKLPAAANAVGSKKINKSDTFIFDTFIFNQRPADTDINRSR